MPVEDFPVDEVQAVIVPMEQDPHESQVAWKKTDKAHISTKGWSLEYSSDHTRQNDPIDHKKARQSVHEGFQQFTNSHGTLVPKMQPTTHAPTARETKSSLKCSKPENEHLILH